jgi:hypothetical protein
LQNIWQGVKNIFFICGRRQEEHILNLQRILQKLFHLVCKTAFF